MGAITSRKPSVDAAIKAEMKSFRLMPQQYDEGYSDFGSGIEDCIYDPQKNANAAYSWWSGWHSAEVGRNLAVVFKRNRIVWP